MTSDMERLIERAKAVLDAMTPAELIAMREAQRQSWLRSMEPCEHGVRDWEDCDQCRALQSRASS